MRGLRQRLSPWAGLLAGALAWALHHQLGSDLVILDCRFGGPWLTGGLGLVCALAVLIAGWTSWGARGRSADPGGRMETRDFAAAVSVLGAGVFLLAIGLQSLSGFIYPACQR